MLRAKFHVVLSLLCVLKRAILMLAYEAPLALQFKMNVPKTETMVNLKSASFIVIMILHEGLTRIQSQIKPRLLVGESFALSVVFLDVSLSLVLLSLPHLFQRSDSLICDSLCLTD